MLYPQLLFCAPVWCYSYPNPVPQVLVLVHYLRGSHWLPLSHQKWGDDTDFVSQTSSLWYFLYRTRFQLHLPQLAQQYFRPTARLNWAFFSSFDWVYSCSGCYRWVWRGVTVVIPSLVLLSSILTLQIPSLTHLQLCSPFFSFLNLSALSFFFVFFYLVLPLPLNQPYGCAGISCWNPNIPLYLDLFEIATIWSTLKAVSPQRLPLLLYSLAVVQKQVVLPSFSGGDPRVSHRDGGWCRMSGPKKSL